MAGSSPCALAPSICWRGLDDDGARNGIMYYEPNQAGEYCSSNFFSLPPPVNAAGNPILQTVAIRVGVSSDDF